MSAVRRRLWWVVTAVSATFVLFGVSDVVGGIAFNTGFADAISGSAPAQIDAQHPELFRLIEAVVRAGGVSLATLGITFVAISAFAYRPGQRWAWWTMWLLPAWPMAIFALFLVVGTAPGQSTPASILSDPIIAIIAAVVLLLDRSRFADA